MAGWGLPLFFGEVEKMMKNGLRRWLVGTLGVSLMVTAGWTFASDNSATIFPAEGNKTCSDYSSNKFILAMGASPSVGSYQVFGTENPRDQTGGTGESATYTLSSDRKTLSFSNASTHIDYVVLKSGTNVTVLIYPSGGVTGDGNMVIPSTTGNLTISSFNLCYGLGNALVVPPPPPLSTTKSCNQSASLDENGVICPTNPTRGPTLVCNIELDQPLFGMKDGSDTCCVCGLDPLTECDPNVPYGEPGACPTPPAGGTKTGAEDTTTIEINKDPYYCQTVGGVRKCYPY